MSSGSAYTVRKPVAVLLSAGALANLGLNVALVVQNRTLKKEMAAPPALLPQVGMKINELEGVALDGSKLQVSFAGQTEQTLLFVFSTRCGVCDLNWPQWQSIAQSVQGEPLRLVYADIMSPLSEEYAKDHGIDHGSLIAELDPRSQLELNLRITPLTVLFGSNGNVERVWAGFLEGNQLTDLRRSLRLASSR